MPPKRKTRSRKAKPYRRDVNRYKAFARHYLALGTPTFNNCVASAIAAGYTESYANSFSYQLPDRPLIQQEMARIREARKRRHTVASPEEVLETLSMMLRTTPEQLFDKDTGELLPVKDLAPEARQLLAGFKFKTRIIPVKDGEAIVEHSTDYKLTDRVKVADMLAKHHGLYEEDNRQKTPDGPALLVAFPTGNMTIAEWQAQVIDITNQARATEVRAITAP